MVKQRQHFRLHLRTEIDHGGQRVVPPTDSRLLKFIRVLTIDHQQLRASEEFEYFITVLPRFEIVGLEFFAATDGRHYNERSGNESVPERIVDVNIAAAGK